MAGKKYSWKGNEAIGEAAIIAGCRYFFGYPITPRTKSRLPVPAPAPGGRHLPARRRRGGGHQHGLWGGRRRRPGHDLLVRSPGVSLKQEGISYLSAAELPPGGGPT